MWCRVKIYGDPRCRRSAVARTDSKIGSYAMVPLDLVSDVRILVSCAHKQALWAAIVTAQQAKPGGTCLPGLPKEFGSQSGVPRHQRVCRLCGTGDKMHLVFECATLADLRGQFPDIFQAHRTIGVADVAAL